MNYNQRTLVNPRFILTGGPGVGKTTTLLELEGLGYPCVGESARAIISERLRKGMPPRPNPVAFSLEILSYDLLKYDSCPAGAQSVFFDRGIVDALGMCVESGALDQLAV